MESSAPQVSFIDFYQHHFRREHRHPVNVALHVVGTLASLILVLLATTWSSPWWLLLYPVVHAGPGLVGHRLFERNPEVGDVRVLRRDFPPLWFIAANHLLTYEVVTRR